MPKHHKTFYDYAAEADRREREDERAAREEELIEALQGLNALMMGFMTGHLPMQTVNTGRSQ